MKLLSATPHLLASLLLVAGCVKMGESSSASKEPELGGSKAKHIHVVRSLIIKTTEPVQPLALAQLKDGGYLVAGQQLKLASAWAMRTDSEGHVIWTVTSAKERDLQHPTQFDAMLAQSDGSALLFGYRIAYPAEAFYFHVDAHGVLGPYHSLGDPERSAPGGSWTPPPGGEVVVIPANTAYQYPSVRRIGVAADGTPIALLPWPSDSPRGDNGGTVVLDGGVTAVSTLVLLDGGQGRRLNGSDLSVYDATANLKSRLEFEGAAAILKGIGDSTKVYVLLDQPQKGRVELGEYAVDGRYRTLGRGDRSPGFTAFHSYRLSTGALVDFGYSNDKQYLPAIRRWSPDLASVEVLESGGENHAGTYGDVVPTGKMNEFIGAYSLFIVSPPAPAERLGVVLDFVQVD